MEITEYTNANLFTYDAAVSLALPSEDINIVLAATRDAFATACESYEDIYINARGKFYHTADGYIVFRKRGRNISQIVSPR